MIPQLSVSSGSLREDTVEIESQRCVHLSSPGKDMVLPTIDPSMSTSQSCKVVSCCNGGLMRC